MFDPLSQNKDGGDESIAKKDCLEGGSVLLGKEVIKKGQIFFGHLFR
jgi:hypothetical protein